MPHPLRWLLWCLAAFMPMSVATAAETLHTRVDALVLARAGGKPAAAAADDAEFLRRVYLDLAGRIPSVQEARSFLADSSPDKRGQLIDQLLAGPDYPRRMQELFHVMLMERMGDHPEWTKYLRESFAANKPWDQMTREVLSGSPKDEATRGAVFFYAKRLENYGQNPVDYPGLTRDVGRLFLGKNLACAQCHDHLFVEDYKQEDFQGLHTFFQNTALADAKAPAITEKPTLGKTEFMSVFKKVRKETGPRIPGLKEIAIPPLKKGEEYATPPDPKTKKPGVLRFSPLAQLAEQLPTRGNPAFSRNIVNRLWFVMMGRGLVHPLDLDHSGNPPSHPELLDLLAAEFAQHQFDIKWLLGELARSQTYQRSSLLPKGQADLPADRFLVANEKRLSAEQLMWSMLEATGEKARILAGKDARGGALIDTVQQKFLRAFANQRREPEEDFNFSLKASLFVLNDDLVLGWLSSSPGNLADRVTKLPDADRVADELYLSVLTRLPTGEEKAEVARYLAKNASRRPTALGHLAWALLASTEFAVNH